MSITFHDPGISAQKPCDVAVVTPTRDQYRQRAEVRGGPMYDLIIKNGLVVDGIACYAIP